ncbi:MAG: hypothetical protein A2138_17640 [Deltaproteobacteria bacterium RBG_16_71_12]|nr:MAG: hypothetical protein A2138_17640 [Deltaproteobacteria bacterium RBG_16_71_12]
MSGLAVRLVFDEDRVVVVDKPCGLTSEDAAAHIGLRLVHRIDRATSGLLLLARDARTVTRLQRALRAGLVGRRYLFIAHGVVVPRRLTSALVRDRGDGLRGSGAGGKPSVADLCHCRPSDDGRTTCGAAELVTGRTHQLRIQLAEAGHPIVGEHVYVRDARRLGLPLIDATRLMLHAERLRFALPGSKRIVEVQSAAPAALVSFVGSTPGPLRAGDQ